MYNSSIGEHHQRRDTEMDRRNHPALRTHPFALAMQSAISLHDVASVFLTAVHDIIDADGIGLYQLHVGSGRVLDVHAAVDDSLLHEYEDRGRGDDPVLAHVLEHRRPFDSSQICASRWHGSGAHTVLEASGFEHSLEAPIVLAGAVTGTINFARSVNLRPFDAADLEVASIVADHLALAIRRAQHLQQVAQRMAMFESAMDRISDRVVLTDTDGRVQYRNRTANDELEAAEKDSDGNDPIDLHVTEAVRQACESIRSDRKRVVVQDIESAGRSFVARTVRLPDRTKAVLTTLHARSRATRDLPVWSVLTRREQQIAEFASQGLSTRLIADRAFISENTVKQHLKRVYAKTGVSSRAELVQLIWAADRQAPEATVS